MTLVIWAFTDGKPGHENQTRGLVNALAAHGPVETHWVRTVGVVRLLLQTLGKGFPPPCLPAPQLLIGAGHATHLPMLLARRACGGRTVVLMKPSLPLSWFDLCVAPEHDGVSAANAFSTRGALNAVTPGEKKDPAAGLILVGGPSRHYGWSDSAMVAQISAIVGREDATHWTLTTSRRTPPRTLERLRGIGAPNLSIVPFEQTDSLWLPTRLASATRVWVSEDSVSMVYEALTSGAATCLLAVPRQHDNRISRGMETLAQDGLITRFADWQQGAKQVAPAIPFNEAARAATWMRKTWLTGN